MKKNYTTKNIVSEKIIDNYVKAFLMTSTIVQYRTIFCPISYDKRMSYAIRR